MLARRYRLTKKDNVEAIMTQGHVAKSRLFVVRSLPNNLSYNRTMALVSSNVADRAPDRNRIRRQIYEVVRLEAKRRVLAPLPPLKTTNYQLQTSFDTIIFPKKSVKDAPFKEMQRQLLSLLTFRPNPS